MKQKIKNFCQNFWRKNKKMVFIIFIFFAILAVLSIKYFYIYSQEYSVSLTGEFSSFKKTFSIKKGVIVFETPKDSCFFLNYGKEQGGEYPWGKVVFVTATIDGVTKKISAPNCWMLTPCDGELIMAINFNSEYFDPKQVEIFTGVHDKSSTGFTDGELPVRIYQYKPGEHIGKISEVADFPEPKPPISTTPQPEVKPEAKAENGKKSFFGFSLPKLSGSGVEGLLEPFPIETQKEIKEGFEEFFKPEKEFFEKILFLKKGEEVGK